MAGPGRIPGRYNLVIQGEYETFDHRMPVGEYLESLKTDEVPDEVSVVGLEEALEANEAIDEFAREMDQRADDLEYQTPTIQFVLEGSFHRNGKHYDLRYSDDFYSLQRIFGPQLERKEQGDWLVAPF
jgi:hypothetical protein